MSSKTDVTVVSIDKYSWSILQKRGFYAFPNNSREAKKYFAFYLGKPISAITHYAEAKSINEGGKIDVGIDYWLQELPDKEPPYIIVKFDKLIKLKTPIKKDNLGRGRGHVQGRIYTSLKKLLKSKTISQLL